MESNQIAENIRSIRGRMAAAAERAGRDPGEILLVGARSEEHTSELQSR